MKKTDNKLVGHCLQVFEGKRLEIEFFIVPEHTVEKGLEHIEEALRVRVKEIEFLNRIKNKLTQPKGGKRWKTK